MAVLTRWHKHVESAIYRVGWHNWTPSSKQCLPSGRDIHLPLLPEALFGLSAPLRALTSTTTIDLSVSALLHIASLLYPSPFASHPPDSTSNNRLPNPVLIDPLSMDSILLFEVTEFTECTATCRSQIAARSPCHGCCLFCTRDDLYLGGRLECYIADHFRHHPQK